MRLSDKEIQNLRIIALDAVRTEDELALWLRDGASIRLDHIAKPGGLESRMDAVIQWLEARNRTTEFIDLLVKDRPHLAPQLAHLREIAAKTATASRSTPVTPGTQPRRPELPELPIVDPLEWGTDRFISREGLLRDFRDAASQIGVANSDRRGRAVQLLWYHGFGGLGKSSFLRRAYLDVSEELTALKVGLIDWHVPRFCEPAPDPILSSRDILDAIACRVGQLFGCELLDPYWQARDHANNTARERNLLRARFDATLRRFETDLAMANSHFPQHTLNAGEEFEQQQRELACLETHLRSAGVDRTREGWHVHLQKLRLSVSTWRRLFTRWAEECGPASTYREELLDPDKDIQDALSDCLRKATEQHALLLIFDTHELLREEHDHCLCDTMKDLLVSGSRLLVVISGRFAPDAHWLNEIPELRRRIVAFDQTAHFTEQEIEKAFRSVHSDRKMTAGLIRAITDFTQGLPLCVGMLLDDYRRRADSFDDWQLPKPDLSRPPEEIARRATALIADRILLHMDRSDTSDDSDYRAIVAIVVCTTRRRRLLQLLWGPRFSDRIHQLRHDHSFIYGDDVHSSLRSHLRRHFRLNPPAPLQELVLRLSQLQQQSSLNVTPNDEDYLSDLLENANLLSWQSEDQAVMPFSRALAVAIAFELDIDIFLPCIEELPAGSPGNQQKKSRLISRIKTPQWVETRQSSLDWLGAGKSDDGTPLEVGSMLVLRALKEVHDGGGLNQPIAYLDRAIQILGKPVPMREEICRAYVANSIALLTESSIRHAFHQATAVGHSPIDFWVKELFDLHDSHVRNDVSDIELEKWARAIPIVADAACEAHKTMTAGDDLELAEEFEPSVLLLVCAHMLSRHLGPREDADSYYSKVVPSRTTGMVAFIRMELADQFVRTGRAREGLAIIDELAESKGFKGAFAEAHNIFCNMSSAVLLDPSIHPTVLRFLDAMKDSPITPPMACAFASASVVASKLKLPSAAEFCEKAISAVDKTATGELNDIAWKFYEASLVLTKAARLAARGYRASPDDLHIIQTYAAILVRMDRWGDAVPLLARWAKEIPSADLERGWNDFVLMFRDALHFGHGPEFADILRETARLDLWSRVVSALAGNQSDAGIDQCFRDSSRSASPLSR